MENRIDAIYARQSVDRKDSKERETEKKQVKKSEETGCPAISSRIAFGPIFIKEFCHLAKTIPQILAARCQLLLSAISIFPPETGIPFSLQKFTNSSFK